MASGLDGIVAAETILGHTDPATGMVWVRGVDLPTLARHSVSRVRSRCCGMVSLATRWTAVNCSIHSVSPALPRTNPWVCGCRSERDGRCLKACASLRQLSRTPHRP
jgi:hypothetical protein